MPFDHLARTALDESLANGIKHLATVFLAGLEDKEPVGELVATFKRGVAVQVEGHETMAAAIDSYFDSRSAPGIAASHQDDGATP